MLVNAPWLGPSARNERIWSFEVFWRVDWLAVELLVEQEPILLLAECLVAAPFCWSFMDRTHPLGKWVTWPCRVPAAKLQKDIETETRSARNDLAHQMMESVPRIPGSCLCWWEPWWWTGYTDDLVPLWLFLHSRSWCTGFCVLLWHALTLSRPGYPWS